MSKVLLASVISGLSASALATTASDTFQWAGTVPQAPVSGTFEIFNKGSVDFTNGLMTFAESETEKGKYEITSSSTLSFGVREVSTKDDASSFEYEVSQVKFSAGGLSQPVNPTKPEFSIMANGVKLVQGTPVKSTTKGETINLTVATDAPTDAVKEGADVVVQSSILVTNAAI
ncbi:hypothetical protein M5252_004729 [Vibrio parahaemolyticus]|nr:hypothetical protein [Vibrio parahaemolyticus]EJE8775169.1 hypothetical protein [Vibrio parahaemolyticus]